MNWLKKRWEITKNWQLLYPIVGTLALLYSAYKLALLFSFTKLIVTLAVTGLIFFVLVKITLALFKFLEKRWNVDYKWKVIRIFIVFAITGSLSVIVTEPIFEIVGFVKDNFGSNAWTVTFFYILKFILILPFYKVLLVFFGWVFGEYKFFLNFAIKIANRFGLKKLTEKIVPKD
ncbi:MAG: hypothetical protein KJO77_06820 [Bacteroidia bacterium]|nr:hypothetical protein [Bacteroidia bacterium]NND50958.1 hypothetical protein [Flavobacteriaceae bacterium]